MKNKILVSMIAMMAFLSISAGAHAENIICFPNNQCIDIDDIGNHP
ncbi:hypothetical protein [Burkholderia pseudomallei]|nr:hypothetical protein [Burkholderia pseudomallei]